SLFFIIGLDAFREIHTWKDYLTLLSLCNFIVTSRPGIALPAHEEWIPVALDKSLCYDPATKMYQHGDGRSLALCEIQGLNISASQVRRAILQGKSIRYLVPRNVQEYIITHSLYH
ncbi:MAG: nicotinate-nicotinamide nucleotide adenylyltransferase, partial [Candidatus Binatia bacterium]